MTESDAPAGARIERPLAEWRWDAAVAVLVGGAAALLSAGYAGDLHGPKTAGWVAVVAALVSSRAADLVSGGRRDELRRVGLRAFLLVAVFAGLVTTVVVAAVGGIGGAGYALVTDRPVWPSARTGLLTGAVLAGAASVLSVALRCIAAALVSLRGGPTASRTWLAVPRDVALLSLASVVVGSASATLAALSFLELSPFGPPELLLPGPAVLLAIATVLRAKRGPGPMRFTR